MNLRAINTLVLPSDMSTWKYKSHVTFRSPNSMVCALKGGSEPLSWSCISFSSDILSLVLTHWNNVGIINAVESFRNECMNSCNWMLCHSKQKQVAWGRSPGSWFPTGRVLPGSGACMWRSRGNHGRNHSHRYCDSAPTPLKSPCLGQAPWESPYGLVVLYLEWMTHTPIVLKYGVQWWVWMQSDEHLYDSQDWSSRLNTAARVAHQDNCALHDLTLSHAKAPAHRLYF